VGEFFSSVHRKLEVKNRLSHISVSFDRQSVTRLINGAEQASESIFGKLL
jgi:hypothetical protein